MEQIKTPEVAATDQPLSELGAFTLRAAETQPETPTESLADNAETATKLPGQFLTSRRGSPDNPYLVVRGKVRPLDFLMQPKKGGKSINVARLERFTRRGNTYD